MKIRTIYISAIILFGTFFGLNALDTDKLYGINQYDTAEEFTLIEKLYMDGLYSKLIKLKDGLVKLNVLEEYIDLINDDTLAGTCMRDSIMLYIGVKNNDEFVKLLEGKYKKNNNEVLKYIANIRKNMGNYVNTSFNFSTSPKRMNIPIEGISLVLPNTKWNISDNKSDSYSIGAGEDTYAGGVVIKIFPVNDSVENFIKTNYFSVYKPILMLRNPGLDKLTTEDMIQLEPTEPRLIAKDFVFGSPRDFLVDNKSAKKIDFVYEQIAVSPDEYDFQIYTGRTRFYIIENKCIVIYIYSYIAGKHVLADRVRLIKKYGNILDSVIIK